MERIKKFYSSGPWNGLGLSGSPARRPNPVFTLPLSIMRSCTVYITAQKCFCIYVLYSLKIVKYNLLN